MDEEEDMHVCLVCQTTISGLMNYVNHKKNECIGKKAMQAGAQQNKPSPPAGTSPATLQSQISEVINNLGSLNNINQINSIYKQYQTNSSGTPTSSGFFNSETDPSNSQPTLAEAGVSPNLTYASIFSSPEAGGHKKTKVANLHETQNFNISGGYGTYTGDQGLLENNDIGDIIPSAQDTGVDSEATEKVDDFFLSLELRSKYAPQGEKNAPNLPISNILSNLTFSSDEEDLGFSFADDVSIDSLSDDTDDMAPPRHHTGGKWKPGQGPGPKSVQLRRRLASRGKWPPGESATPKATNKRYKRQTKGGKWKPETTADNKKTKTYSCNFCNITFSNRFMYSSHCGSIEHKENVFGHNKPVESYARGGKAKSISMITRSKAQYDSDVTEDYENDNEQRLRDENERMEADVETVGEKENKGPDMNDGKTDVEKSLSIDEKIETDKANTVEENKDAVNSSGQPEPSQPSLIAIHICSICDKKYNNKYVLSRHLLTKVHQNRAKGHPDAVPLLQKYHKYIVRLSPYQCLICRYFFNKNEFFENHIKSEEHANNCIELIGEIKCSICSFKTHLHEAMIEHINGKEHKENVSKCNKLCVIKESHVRCQCKYCGVIVRAYSRLKRHIILKHPDKEVTSPAVRRKVGVHNRPRCSVCQERCNSESALKIHIRRRHTGERPFHCDICTKSFADRGSRDLHYKSQKHAQKILQNQYAMSQKQEDQTNTSRNVEEAKVVVKSEENEELVHSIAAKVAENVMLTFNKNVGTDNDPTWTLGKKSTRGRPRGRPGKEISNLNGTTSKRRKLHPNKIKCKHCDVIVANYNDLRPHYMKEHSTQVRLCELCDMVFLSARSLRLHFLSRVHQKNMNQNEDAVEDTTYYKCSVCLKKFVDQRYCKFHTEYQHNHLNSEEGVLKKFNGQDLTRQKYKEYLAEVEPLDRAAAVRCPECKKDLKKNNLMDHLRMHTGEKVFVCRLCHRGFISSVTLRRHLLGHFGCQDCSCEICGKSYKKQSTLDQHLTIHQMEKAGEQKMHICDVCGQSFYFEHQLAQHARRHQDRKFKCTFPGCHWRFVFKNELSYHLRSHSQEKPYLCDICGYAASTKIRLQRHNVTHTGERKYHCEYCTYKAGNSTHLHRHMRIHIGSKPYKCPYCDYSCNTHENIRKHIAKTKKHEGMKIYPCKLCTYGTNSSKEFRNHLFECHECEVEDRNLDALSSFTGLYAKHEDPKRPAEGMQVIQVKEKTPRNSGNLQKKRKPKVKEPSPVRDEDHESIAKAMLYFSQDRSSLMRPGEYGLEDQNVYEDQNASITEDNSGKYPPQEYQAITPPQELNHITLSEVVQGQEQVDQMNQYRTDAMEYQRPGSPLTSPRIDKQPTKLELKRGASFEVIKSKTAEGLVQIIQERGQEFGTNHVTTKLEEEQVDEKFYTSMMAVPGSVAVMLAPVRQFGSYSNQDVVYQPHAFIDQHGNDVTKHVISLGQTTKSVQLPPPSTLTQQITYGQNVTYNTSMFHQSPSQETQPDVSHLTRDQETHVLKPIHDGQKSQAQRHPEVRSLLNRHNYKYNSEDYQFKESREHENEDGSLVIDMSTYIQNA